MSAASPTVRWTALLAVLLVAGLVAQRLLSRSAGAQPGASPHLELVATYESGMEADAEIVAVQTTTARALLTLSKGASVDVLDLRTPAAPARLARHQLPAREREELTCVAFHPTEDWFLAVLNHKDAATRGRLLFVRASDGAILAERATGYAPDAVAIAPDGATAVVADEAEWYAPAPDGTWQSQPGTVTFVDLRAGPSGATVRTVEIGDLPSTPGVTTGADGREVEREVAGTEVKIPLDTRAQHVEPENVAYSPDSRRAYVTLQENNAVLVVDPVAGRILGVWGLGTTTHAADLRKDGVIAFDQTLTALREPDGIAVTADGRFVVTADEGDTDPKASKTPAGKPSGGGRTVSVFEAATGRLVGDTGDAIDKAAAAIGRYDDGRSENKGAEPEGVVTFRRAGRDFAVVGLERAAAVVLVALAADGTPKVVAAYPLGGDSKGPEGLAVLAQGDEVHVLVANEKSGDLSVFRFVP